MREEIVGERVPILVGELMGKEVRLHAGQPIRSGWSPCPRKGNRIGEEIGGMNGRGVRIETEGTTEIGRENTAVIGIEGVTTPDGDTCSMQKHVQTYWRRNNCTHTHGLHIACTHSTDAARRL
mmetsp:Transcript_31891/g.59431  ORF Transcript_31891/g.59431 Transcript_31891/m.59431 type:complete len:123 (+) Transcript_31891:305-673(+)